MGQKDLLGFLSHLGVGRRRQHSHALEELDPLPLCLRDKRLAQMVTEVGTIVEILAKT
jgi:hypothetical protein